MILDRAEREKREGVCRGAYSFRSSIEAASLRAQWLREAHARIEELEEAYHAARQRCEELEIRHADLNGAFIHEVARAEGYRRSAIILRDLAAPLKAERCPEEGCTGWVRKPYYHLDRVTGWVTFHRCWRHR